MAPAQSSHLSVLLELLISSMTDMTRHRHNTTLLWRFEALQLFLPQLPQHLTTGTTPYQILQQTNCSRSTPKAGAP